LLGELNWSAVGSPAVSGANPWQPGDLTSLRLPSIRKIVLSSGETVSHINTNP